MTTRLSTGSTAPAFSLPDASETIVSLADYAGRQVVLYFYPAAMTPGCTLEAIDFNASLAVFNNAGYSVIGISPDSTTRLAKFAGKSDLHFKLLSNPTKEVINAYGAFGTKQIYGKEIAGVLRATFIIKVGENGVGTIQTAHYNVKATGHVDRLKRELGI